MPEFQAVKQIKEKKMKKIIVALAAVAMMAGSAYAAEWDFYGSARVSTFYSDTDQNGVANNTDTVFSESLQSNSRIGANVKVSDELAGRFEYGATSGNANIRLLYGEWNFGAGKLLVGQDYVPLYLPGSNQVYSADGGLEGYGGEMYGSRHAQLKLTFGTFQIAAVEPDLTYDDSSTTAHAKGTGTDIVLPAIHVQYALVGSNWKVLMAGGYQTFDVDQTTGGDVTSWGLGVDASMTLGALSFTAQVNGGTNVGNLWFIDVMGSETADAEGRGYADVDAAGVVTDNDALGFRICAAYKVNDMFGLEIGYGFQQTELDEANSIENESESYYVQAPITMAPGVFVVPEVGVVNYKEGTEDDTTYFGAKWQINF